MTPHNMVPSRVPRQVRYTDGTPSREVEDDEDWDVEDKEEMKKLKEGFAYKKKPNLMDVRDELNRLEELLDVISTALLADNTTATPLKVYGAIQTQVLPKIKELEQELARL